MAKVESNNLYGKYAKVGQYHPPRRKRPPAESWSAEVAAFLTTLALERKVSTSIQNSLPTRLRSLLSPPLRACPVPKTFLYGDSFHFLHKLIRDKRTVTFQLFSLDNVCAAVGSKPPRRQSSQQRPPLFLSASLLLLQLDPAPDDEKYFHERSCHIKVSLLHSYCKNRAEYAAKRRRTASSFRPKWSRLYRCFFHT
jgi:hypothetical protein